jgi:hypothetical protein
MFTAHSNHSLGSGAWQFATEREAIEYIFDQYRNVMANKARSRARGDNTWIEYDVWRSRVVRPDGTSYPAAYVLMV